MLRVDLISYLTEKVKKRVGVWCESMVMHRLDVRQGKKKLYFLPSIS